MPTTTDPDRARAFDTAVFAAAADEVVEHPWGLQLRTPSLPLVRNLNALYADAPLDPELIERLDPVAVYIAGDAPALGGWLREHGVLMAHRGDPPEPDPRVSPAPFEAVTHLRREWLDAEVPHPDITEQVVAGDA